MTTKAAAAILMALFLVGCGEEGSVAPAAPVSSDGAAVEKADAEARKALSDALRLIAEELDTGKASPERKAELEAERKRISEQLKKANQERMRRDREEFRRMISEQKRGAQ